MNHIAEAYAYLAAHWFGCGLAVLVVLVIALFIALIGLETAEYKAEHDRKWKNTGQPPSWMNK